VCGKCHDKKLARLAHDWHVRALSPATSRTVAGKFTGVRFRGSSSDAQMTARGGRYIMRTPGTSDEAADFEVSWVIGGKRMQDAVTVFPDGRWQVLPVYYHVTAGAWVDYTEAKQGRLTPDHPFYWTNFRRTANRECLDCHTTGLEVSYDRATHRFETTFVDAGVTCESCHGPGGKHADTQEPADIVDPAKLPPAEALAVCGQCHGPRNPLFPIFDVADHFRPGMKYEDRFQALVVVDGSARSGDFFADGRPRTSSFEYQALVQSRCHRQGQATCLSCHAAPHESARAGELAVAADDTCKKCHADVLAAGREHTRHVAAAAQRCAACHMPPVVSGVLDSFADHALDVPDPSVTSSHGVPNACNACHAHEKQAPAEMAVALARLWPEAAARQERRRRLADAIDEATRERSRAPLLAVVADADEAPTLRGAAAVLLGQRFPDAIDAVRPLLHDVDPLLRHRAVEAIAAARARSAVPALVPLAAGDPSLSVRQFATLTLFDLGAAGDAEKAARALIADPDGDALPQLHVLLSVAAGRRHQLDEARRQLDRALALAPYDAPNLVLSADLDRVRGDEAAAAAALEEALRFSPRDPAVLRRLR
jgi:hypothetical protein